MDKERKFITNTKIEKASDENEDRISSNENYHNK